VWVHLIELTNSNHLTFSFSSSSSLVFSVSLNKMPVESRPERVNVGFVLDDCETKKTSRFTI